jgi:hypothetical protein
MTLFGDVIANEGQACGKGEAISHGSFPDLLCEAESDTQNDKLKVLGFRIGSKCMGEHGINLNFGREMEKNEITGWCIIPSFHIFTICNLKSVI